MPRFRVLVREVHVSHRIIEADNAEEAVRLVNDGDGEEIFLEYSHTLEDEDYPDTVSEEKEAE